MRSARASAPAVVPRSSRARKLARVRGLHLRHVLRRPRRTPPPPPFAPPSGPRSITQSAHLTTSRLCSITTTVLPASTSRCSTPSRRCDVLEVQAGRGLVEHVERAPGLHLAELARELDALRLAAATSSARSGRSSCSRARRRRACRGCARAAGTREQLEALVDARVEHVGDVLALVADRERLRRCSACPPQTSQGT